MITILLYLDRYSIITTTYCIFVLFSEEIR